MIESKVETITPEVAKVYLTLNKFNRPLNKTHVMRLAKDMRDGHWELNGEPIKFDDSGNLVDGQHRLQAVIESGVAVCFLVVRGISPRSFTTLDTGKNRSNADVFNINGINNAATVSSVTLRYMLLSQGLRALDGGASGGLNHNFTKSQILGCYRNSPNLFQEAARFGGWLSHAKMPILTKTEIGGLYAYLVHDKRHEAEVVKQFLTELCSGHSETLAVEQVGLKLGRMRMSGIRLNGKDKTNLLAKAWNRYIFGIRDKGVNNKTKEWFR